jgi:hypothetical protein
MDPVESQLLLGALLQLNEEDVRHVLVATLQALPEDRARKVLIRLVTGLSDEQRQELAKQLRHQLALV